MATTLTLQNSINFVASFIKNQPLLINNMEPALTAANIVLQTMLGPPMRWRFNRVNASFAVTDASTDYVQTLNDFGWLETQWLKDGSGGVHPMEGAVALPVDGNKLRPTKLAVEFDDNAGGITFRLDHTPDQDYTVYCDYQKKAVLLTSPAATWGPVADEFEYVYQYGFLCLASLLVNDSRFPIFEQYFISRLLGAQDGLSDQERNIFVGNWMNLAGTLTRSSAMVNAGIAGRGK
jgi:hypothetical protein